MRFTALALCVFTLALSLVPRYHAIPLDTSAESIQQYHSFAKLVHQHPHVGRNKMIRGVNLGGWFVLEAWMAPSFFDSTVTKQKVVDQYTLMTNTDASYSHSKLLKHWKTWITETDFQQIKAAGLNTVRIPVPHWAFNGSATEPYWANAERPYISQALLWASKYGLDVILDMHTAPNSQNGYDNSGRAGQALFASTTPSVNVARLISALSTMVKLYVNDAKYQGVVKGIEVLNEPACFALGDDFMSQVYLLAYPAIRKAVSRSAMVVPTVVFHDCFIQPLSNLYGFFNKTSKAFVDGSYAVDSHRYQAFPPQSDHLNTYDEHIDYTCGLQAELADSQSNQFSVIVGEWSLGLANGGVYSTMNASVASQNTPEQNNFFRRWYEAQATTYEMAGGWIFWNWKTETFANWSYKDAMKQGWIPTNPTDRMFTQSNGCPTNTTTSKVTFASQNNTASAVRKTKSSSLPLTPIAANVSLVLGNTTLSHATNNKKTTSSKKREFFLSPL